MILNLGSLAFNADIEKGGGTPAWGTEMGQGEGYKFVFEDMSDFFTGLVYSSVPDIENVTCPLGKGGNQRADYDFVIASLFRKVFVNGLHVDNASFLLLIVKKINGNHHVGRRTLKYNPRMTYHGELINHDCYRKMAFILGLSEDAAWFINEIDIKNQDEIHFTAYILENQAALYRDNDERRNVFLSKLPKGNKTRIQFDESNDTKPLQRIFYGAPGTGKSHFIKEQTKGEDVIRTTFHPDTDYSTFVGTYKPTTEFAPVLAIIGDKAVETGRQEKRISYEFVSQAFLQAYVAAWKKVADALGGTPKKQFLVIEEINRGNCAQIFGDLFQLLDRNVKGYSEYPIQADADMKKQLKKSLNDLVIGNKESINELYNGRNVVDEVLNGDILLLPNNLYIWATMNTSDQSLFPIDSAFKRRWDWQYIPISDAKKGWLIEANGKRYDWWNFLEKMNAKIGVATHSEDKKLGYFFCKPKNGIIDAETFVGKVVFYIWNDVFKDFAEEAGELFRDEDGSLLTFNKFYTVGMNGRTEVVKEKVERLLQNLGVEPISDTNLEDVIEDEDGNETLSTIRDYSKFSVNGIGRYAKNNLAAECMKKYIELNPNMSIDDVLSNWRGLGNVVPHFVESKEEYEARTDNSKRSHEIPCGNSVIYVAHNGYGNNGKVFTLIEAVNKMNWGITLAKVEE